MKALIFAALLLSACTSTPVKVHKFSENQDSPKASAKVNTPSSIIDDFLASDSGKALAEAAANANFD